MTGSEKHQHMRWLNLVKLSNFCLNYQRFFWVLPGVLPWLTIKREGLTGLNHPEMRDQWPKQLPHTSHEGASSWIDPILNHRFQEGIS